MVHNLFLPVGLAFFLIALALLLLLINEWRDQRQRLLKEHRHELDLPDGELVYEDADGQGEPLVSNQYPLMGKPDYIIQLPDGRPMPVELKLGVQDMRKPYSNHILQLAAYCLILEDYFELPPTHGMLRYADCDFSIAYTPALRKKVIKMLNEMSAVDEEYQPILEKQQAGKCRACAFQAICPVGHDK